MADKPLEVLRKYLDSIQRLDADACLALFTDSTVIITPLMPDGMPRQMQGRETLEPAYRALFSRFERYEWINARFNGTDDPELAVVRCSSNGLLKSGGEYQNDYCIFVRASGGKLIEATEYFNPLKAATVFAH